MRLAANKGQAGIFDMLMCIMVKGYTPDTSNAGNSSYFEMVFNMGRTLDLLDEEVVVVHLATYFRGCAWSYSQPQDCDTYDLTDVMIMGKNVRYPDRSLTQAQAEALIAQHGCDSKGRVHIRAFHKLMSDLWGDPVGSKVGANASVGGNQTPGNAPAVAPLLACDIHQDVPMVGVCKPKAVGMADALAAAAAPLPEDDSSWGISEPAVASPAAAMPVEAALSSGRSKPTAGVSPLDGGAALMTSSGPAPLGDALPGLASAAVSTPAAEVASLGNIVGKWSEDASRGVGPALDCLHQAGFVHPANAQGRWPEDVSCGGSPALPPNNKVLHGTCGTWMTPVEVIPHTSGPGRT